MVRLPPVSGLIPTIDQSNKSGVNRKLLELDRLVAGRTAVGVQGEEHRVESGTFSWESLFCSRDGVEGRAEVHKQDPGVGAWEVQLLEDEVEGRVDSIVYRPVGSVGKIQGVQEGLQVGQD
ncbi:uncharacterized protein AB9W97_008292 [Spinachia spinachia]